MFIHDKNIYFWTKSQCPNGGAETAVSNRSGIKTAVPKTFWAVRSGPERARTYPTILGPLLNLNNLSRDIGGK